MLTENVTNKIFSNKQSILLTKNVTKNIFCSLRFSVKVTIHFDCYVFRQSYNICCPLRFSANYFVQNILFVTFFDNIFCSLCFSLYKKQLVYFVRYLFHDRVIYLFGSFFSLQNIILFVFSLQKY